MGMISDAITSLSDALGLKEPLDDLADSVGDFIRHNPELSALAGFAAGGLPWALGIYSGIQGRNQADAMKKAQKQQLAAAEEARRRQQAMIERQNRERQRTEKFNALAADSARQRAMAGMRGKQSFARGTLLSGGGLSDSDLNLGKKTLLGQ